MGLQEFPLLSNKGPKSLLPPLDQQEGCSLQRCLAENSSVLETLWDLTLKPQMTATTELTGHILKRPANPVKGAERKNKTKKLRWAGQRTQVNKTGKGLSSIALALCYGGCLPRPRRELQSHKMENQIQKKNKAKTEVNIKWNQNWKARSVRGRWVPPLPDPARDSYLPQGRASLCPQCLPAWLTGDADSRPGGHTEEQREGSRYPRLRGKKRRQTEKEKVWERQARKGSKNTQDKTTDTNKGSRPRFQGIKHAAQNITQSQNTAFDFSLRYKKRKNNLSFGHNSGWEVFSIKHHVFTLWMPGSIFSSLSSPLIQVFKELEGQKWVN